jgi:hydrogenase maturation protein HypF
VATRLGLPGWVRNSNSGLSVEVEGTRNQIDEFLKLLEAEQPPAAVIIGREILHIEQAGFSRFEILASEESEAKSTCVLPDLASCPECLCELANSRDRRFGYAFTNCTHCGPRYSIVLDIPYDRANTTMREFNLCPACRKECESSDNRRFHAQPNACPSCGPKLWVEPQDGDTKRLPIDRVAESLALGEIVALKGIGGFQLMVDARNSTAVARLRARKAREEKPFALLMPTIAAARQFCEISDAEEKLLTSAASPIALLRPKDSGSPSPEVSKGSPYLGVMLPYSPLHHVLMARYPFPVVATSGNRSGEPIAIGNEEARQQLNGIADVWLLHNRPIARPCDDSVARVSGGTPQILRRARGYAPLPVVTAHELRPVLAVGGHLKNTVAIAIGRDVFLSQHVGDLDTAESRRAFERAIDDLCRLYRFKPEAVACDLHPDYASTRWAIESGLPVRPVQHHQAHVAACAAENGIENDYLGVSWDGTGLGLDGTIWGGEFFRVRDNEFGRFAHLRPFYLPGGEAATRDCSRPAASLVWETLGADRTRGMFGNSLCTMIERQINSPLTSSVGRLFDAVSYLCGVAERNRFEGQAAMYLEAVMGRLSVEDRYEIESSNGIGDWSSLIKALLADRERGLTAAHIAAKFHNALAHWIVQVAQAAGIRNVVLSGGVFQNAYLSELVCALLEERGFRTLTHHQVPANDGGIALGQAVLAGRREG